VLFAYFLCYLCYAVFRNNVNERWWQWSQKIIAELNITPFQAVWVIIMALGWFETVVFYLENDDCCLVSDSTRHSLRSADVPTCVVPRTLGSYGDRTFAATGPWVWSFLLVQLNNPDITYGLFRLQLKGHLRSLSEAWIWRSVTSDMWHLRITLTYLLTTTTTRSIEVILCTKAVTSRVFAGNVWMLFFEVKFYPSDPTQLKEEQTRFLSCFQHYVQSWTLSLGEINSLPAVIVDRHML